MSDSFGQLFDGFRRGREAKAEERSRLPTTGSRRQRAAARKREAGRHSLHQESLEPRLALAITISGYNPGTDYYEGITAVPGQLVIASDQADDVFVKQVASVSQDLLVADNSSFLGYKAVSGIDSYDSVFITNGTARSDADLLPVGYPNSSPNGTTSLFMLPDAYYDQLSVSLTLTQSDGTASVWVLDLKGWDFYEPSRNDGTATVVSGPGYGGQAMLAGWVRPSSVDFTDYSSGANNGLAQASISVVWSDRLTSSPAIVGANLAYGSPGAGSVRLEYVMPGAIASLADSDANQRSLGVVPATLRGTLSTAWGTISYFSDNAGRLRFGDGSSATYFDRSTIGNRNGPGVAPSESGLSGQGNVKVTGRVVGSSLVFDFTNWQTLDRFSSGQFRLYGGMPLAGVEGDLAVNVSYLTYTEDPTPSQVTMFAGQDFTRELAVDLLTPGSTFNSDTKLAVASSVAGGAGDYDLRATNININAPMASRDRFYAGRSQSAERGSRLTGGLFTSSPTLGLPAPSSRQAAAIAEVNKDGTVPRLAVLPGQEGYGYDTDNPPVVTVGQSQAVAAKAEVTRISGSVVRVSISDNGKDYTNGARVTFSQPESGFIGTITVNSGGSGYRTKPNVLLYGGGGTGATADAVWNQATGIVTGVTITNPGRDYVTAPNVYFYEANAATQTLKGAVAARATAFLDYDVATGIANVVDGSITSITVVNPGSGYSSPPTVSIQGNAGPATTPGGATTPPTGTGAAATAVIQGGVVEAPITVGGIGYTKNSTVQAQIQGSGGARDGLVQYQTDDAGTVRDDLVLSIQVLDGGFGYFATNPPSVTVLGGDGNAAAIAQVTADGRIDRIVVTNPGSGYRTPPVIVIGGPRDVVSRAAVAVAAVSQPLIIDAGVFQSVASASVVIPGALPTAPVNQATATWSEAGLAITNPGSGYQAGETVNVYVWGGGSTYADLPVDPSRPAIRGFYGRATVAADGTISSITPANLASFGGRFTSAPTVFIEPPDSVAAFLAQVDGLGRVSQYVQLQKGFGYFNRPVVTVASPSASATATAVAAINAVTGAVTSIDVVTNGYGYVAPPRVVIAPPEEGLGGVPARAEAVIDSEGRVIGFTIVEPGSGYRARPTVTIADVNPRACVESLNVNARVEANIFELYVGDDVGTDTDRGRLFVSPTGGLGAANGSQAASSYIEATVADIFVESSISAANQSYLFNSSMPSSQLAPFVFTTKSPSTDADTGMIVGNVVNITMGNRMPTPLLGTAMFSTVDLSTDVRSLRIRAGEDPANPAGPFPYQVDIREKSDLVVEAVAASSFPISLRAAGSVTMPAGLTTAGDLTIVAKNADPSVFTAFTVTAPIATDYGSIRITADAISVKNSLEVRAAAVTDARQDIVLTADRGDIELVGRISAVNDVYLSQKNRDASTRGRIYGASRVRGRGLFVDSEGSVDIGTKVSRLTGRAATGFTVTEADDILIDSLSSGGLVKLTANGVDPGSAGGVDSPSRVALTAYLREVNQLSVSTPNGSNEVYVDTATPVTLGSAADIASKQGMFSAGSTKIRTIGADVTVLDAPVGGSSARLVRVATNVSLSAASGNKPVTYNPGAPGTVAATLSGEGSLPVIDGVTLVVGDRVLVKDQRTAGVAGIRQNRENGIYEVAKIGGGVLGSSRWQLRRTADADTSIDVPTNSLVRVGEGSSSEKVFRIGYAAIPTTLVERDGTNQLQLPADFSQANVARLYVGQPVTGTGIATGAQVAAISNTLDGQTLVRLKKVDATVSSSTQDRATLATSFNGYNSLFVGQKVFGEGVLPGTIVTKVNAVGRAVSVSPGGLPKALAIGAADAGATPSLFHDEFFDSWVDLDPAFNDFNLIHVGQRVTGAGLKAGGALITGIEPTLRRIGFAAGSIDDEAAASQATLSFASASILKFGMTQGIGAGYADFQVAPLGLSAISVVEAAATTTVGSDAEGTSVSLVVTSTGTTNSAPSSLGKMLSLRQFNDATSLRGNPQAMNFSFQTLAGPIFLDQELPQISKPFSIVGNNSVVVDGSRITRNRAGAPVGSTGSRNGFEFVAGSGANGATAGASLSNITIGGFSKGAAVQVTGATGVLIDSVVLGQGRSSTGGAISNTNGYGIRVSGAGSVTVINSRILSSKQYRNASGSLVGGEGIRTESQGIVTVVGTTVGGDKEGNDTGIVLAGGVSRIGIAPAANGTQSGRVLAGSRLLTLPATVPADAVYVGQAIGGFGTQSGTVITAINGNVVTLSKPMTATGATSLAFGRPARNAVQNNTNGIRLDAGSSTVTNTDVRSNVFAGISIEGGLHTIGMSTALTDSSNALYDNGTWAIDMSAKAAIESQRIQGNYFGSPVKSTAPASNQVGDVAVSGDYGLATALGYNPIIPTDKVAALDKWGNQYVSAANGTGGTGTGGTGTGGTGTGGTGGTGTGGTGTGGTGTGGTGTGGTGTGGSRPWQPQG